jgi:ssDNA-binding Zn-finger/Zn-ribbon topoisomerase 1
MAYYLHDVTCPLCSAEAVVCTDEEDGFGSDDFFEYTCPACNEEVEFNPVVVKASRECPDGSVEGFLVEE